MLKKHLCLLESIPFGLSCYQLIERFIGLLTCLSSFGFSFKKGRNLMIERITLPTRLFC
jgi:hypothetical protein